MSDRAVPAVVAHFTTLLSAVHVLGERVAQLHAVLQDMLSGAPPTSQAFWGRTWGLQMLCIDMLLIGQVFPPPPP